MQWSNKLDNFKLTLGQLTQSCNLKIQLVAIVGDMVGDTVVQTRSPPPHLQQTSSGVGLGRRLIQMRPW